MIEIWFFIMFYLGPGPSTSSVTTIYNSGINGYLTQVICELEREEMYNEMNGWVDEDGDFVVVSPKCYSIEVSSIIEGREV